MTPGAREPATPGGREAQAISRSVQACPSVAGMSGGRFGQVATYLPGQRIIGVRVTATDIAFLLTRMLARIDAVGDDIAELETKIEESIRPLADAVERLSAIPGIARTTAQAIIAEIGVDMTRFPTAAHLASWAKFSPITKESAGKKTGKNSTGHGNPYLARVLGQAAVNAGKTNTFLGERYRRLARRCGKKKAIVALGRSLLIVIWHLLSDPAVDFVDLGPDHYDTRGGTQRAIRNHVTRLQALGYKVTLEVA